MISRRSLVQSTALLIVCGVTFPAGEWFLGFRSTVFGFPTLVMAVALGFDLVAEWRFRQRHGGRVACLIEMDNVYCACYFTASCKAWVRLDDSRFPLPLALLHPGADLEDGTSRTGGRAEPGAGDDPARQH